MAIDAKNYIPALMAGADLSASVDLTVGDDLSVVETVAITAPTATQNALDITSTAITTGKAVDVSDLNALTTGIGVHVASSATAITGAGRLVYSNHTGASGTSAVLNEFASAAADETVIAKVTASAALAAGVAFQVSGAAVTTGNLIAATDADALTTGGIARLVSNSADTTARPLLYVKNDHASATGANCAELVNDSTASPLKTTSGAVSTNYFRVGTFNGVTLWVGNGNTANGVLSGTAGDLILNAGSNKPEYCTGTTNWTALV